VILGHDQWVNSVSVSSDGKKVASASGDSTARVWDLESGKAPQIFNGHNASEVNSVTFPPDTSRIASGSDDCTFVFGLWSRGKRYTFPPVFNKPRRIDGDGNTSP